VTLTPPKVAMIVGQGVDPADAEKYGLTKSRDAIDQNV
jgi:hypothetical protein